MAASPYRLPEGQSARDLYEKLAVRRQIVLDAARRCSEVTIPSIIPPENYQAGDPLYTPFQSFGARCLNNISSRLLLTQLPPNRPIFKHEIADYSLDAMEREEDKQNPKGSLKARVEAALSKREEGVRSRMESTPLRMIVNESTRNLLVGGNVLLRHQKLAQPLYHDMNHYVVQRNNRGEQLLVILKEPVAVHSLPPDVQALVRRKGVEASTAKQDGDAEAVDIYTVCQKAFDQKGTEWWYSWEEYAGVRIPGTNAKDPVDAPPLYAAWLIPVYGSNWGRSYVDEYYGDLLACENLSKALQDAAAICSWLVFLVNPESATRLRDFQNAPNLAWLAGREGDISVPDLGKSADFKFVSDALQGIIQRLAFAFLLNSAIQRNGERVTAEEIRLMARELDEAMGGVYASISQTVQRWWVMRFLHLLDREDRDFPKLPKTNIVSIKVITGIDTLGRNAEAENLRELAQDITSVFGQEAAAKQMSISEYGARQAANKGIPTDGLFREAATIASEEQQARGSAIMDKTIPGVAQEGMKGLMDGKIDPAALQAALQSAGVPATTQGAQPAQ